VVFTTKGNMYWGQNKNLILNGWLWNRVVVKHISIPNISNLYKNIWKLSFRNSKRICFGSDIPSVKNRLQARTVRAGLFKMYNTATL
jgi:hypothetical protein